jgi:hypothetical protein
LLYFDHLYTNDPGHKFWNHMEKLGFVMDTRETEHPGKKFCRFVRFEGGHNPHKSTFLEFIYSKSGGVPTIKPGLSFGYSRNLEGFYKKIRKDGKYKVKFGHKNYDWKVDRVSRLPGWNFMRFSSLGFSALYPWFTEFEPRPGGFRPYKKLRHKNGAQRIHGFVLELNSKGEDFFSYLLGKKLSEKTRMRDGTMLYITRGKRTTIRSVILECKSVSRFVKKYGCDEEGEFFGKPAAKIKNPAGMWDILLI